VPQPARIRLTSGGYPLYTAGDLRSLAYDTATGRLRLSAVSARVRFGDDAHATVVFRPAGAIRTLRATGARLVVTPRAGGWLAYAFPTGGLYTVSEG